MNLLEARRLLGWSQRTLARRSGVSQQMISYLEIGHIKRVAWVDVARLVVALQRAGLKGSTAEELFPVEPVVSPEQRENQDA
jgi:transcriptional regulator with XRE-family HTH domain